MNFGITGRAGGFELARPEQIPRLAKFAEDLKFSSFWMQEEHFIEPGGPSVCLSPEVLGAAVASRTRKIRIGFSVLLLPLHNPLKLAENISTLDVISRGRIDFGISRGFPGRYFDAYQEKPGDGSRQFRRSLNFMLDCWMKPKKRIDEVEYSIEPKPFQKPHPPIYVATYTPETARWVARSGYFLIQHGIQSTSHVRKMLQAYERAGGNVGSVPLSRFVYVGHDDSAAKKELLPTIRKLTQFLSRIRIYKHGFLNEKDLEPDRFIERMVLSGGPETVFEQIRALREDFGVNYLNSLIAFYGCLPLSKTQKSMVIMSRRIMPKFVEQRETTQPKR